MLLGKDQGPCRQLSCWVNKLGTTEGSSHTWGVCTSVNCLRPVHCTGEWSPYGNQGGSWVLVLHSTEVIFIWHLLIDWQWLNHIPTFLLGVILGKQWYTCLTVVFLAPRTQRMFQKCLSNFFHQDKLSKEEYVNVIFTSILDCKTVTVLS